MAKSLMRQWDEDPNAPWYSDWLEIRVGQLEAQLAEAKREARREAFREAVKIAENMADELENCSDMRARNFLAVAEALRRETAPIVVADAPEGTGDNGR